MDDHGTPLLTYEVHGSDGDYIEEWYCQPPAQGTVYRVTESDWSADYTVRKIYAAATGKER